MFNFFIDGMFDIQYCLFIKTNNKRQNMKAQNLIESLLKKDQAQGVEALEILTIITA